MATFVYLLNRHKRDGRTMFFMAPTIDIAALKPGDHIYSWRLMLNYAHHGIYVGEKRVIHFTVSKDSSGPFASSARQMDASRRCSDCGYCGESGVIETCLNCFLKGGKIKRYEYGVTTEQYKTRKGGTCHTVVADRSRKRIIQRARERLQRGFGVYSLTDNNCEHFAIYCMTGQQGILSPQVDRRWENIQFLRNFLHPFSRKKEEFTRVDIRDSSEDEGSNAGDEEERDQMNPMTSGFMSSPLGRFLKWTVTPIGQKS